jgi:hypothetical protein
LLIFSDSKDDAADVVHYDDVFPENGSNTAHCHLDSSLSTSLFVIDLAGPRETGQQSMLSSRGTKLNAYASQTTDNDSCAIFYSVSVGKESLTLANCAHIDNDLQEQGNIYITIRAGFTNVSCGI